MKTFTDEFRRPASVAIMFACLSVLSTAATALMPLVL
jgi:hypothetical protein